MTEEDKRDDVKVEPLEGEDLNAAQIKRQRGLKETILKDDDDDELPTNP